MPTPDERTGMTSEEQRNRALLGLIVAQWAGVGFEGCA